MRLSFTVPGEPVPQPRPKVSTQGGFARAYVPAKHPIHRWKLDIVDTAVDLHMRNDVPDGWMPVSVYLVFRMPRPKSQTRKKGPNPELPHVKRPDVDNLAKAVLDALTGVLWKDDGQVQRLAVTKVVAAGGADPGVDVVVEW